MCALGIVDSLVSPTMPPAALPALLALTVTVVVLPHPPPTPGCLALSILVTITLTRFLSSRATFHTMRPQIQHSKSLRYFPFRRVINKHGKVVQRFLGRECKPIVARTVAPNLFRRMYSVAWPHGRRTSQG